MLFSQLPEFFKNEDKLRRLWNAPDTHQKLLQGLIEKGFGETQLSEMQSLIDAENSDLFDVWPTSPINCRPLPAKNGPISAGRHQERQPVQHQPADLPRLRNGPLRQSRRR